MSFHFPKGFYFGAATSAHQVEGGNRNDWTEWEEANAERLAAEAKKNSLPGGPDSFRRENYISGKSCDHYNQFEKDFDIAKKLGHNTHRFSIEWSRIEPLEGRFNEKEIEHYRSVVRALRKRGIEPFVTLWHWTLPIWMRNKGGIASKEFPLFFSRYARRMAESLKTDVIFWTTLNEPNALIQKAYIDGVWPPQEKSFMQALRAFRNLAHAHREAHEIIHNVIPSAQVGSSSADRYFEPTTKNPPDILSVAISRFLS